MKTGARGKANGTKGRGLLVGDRDAADIKLYSKFASIHDAELIASRLFEFFSIQASVFVVNGITARRRRGTMSFVGRNNGVPEYKIRLNSKGYNVGTVLHELAHVCLDGSIRSGHDEAFRLRLRVFTATYKALFEGQSSDGGDAGGGKQFVYQDFSDDELSRIASMYHPVGVYRLLCAVYDIDSSITNGMEFLRQYTLSTNKSMNRILSTLTEREREVLILRFGLNDARSNSMTLQIIGETYSLTSHKVRQIEKRALQKMRTLPNLKEIEKIFSVPMEVQRKREMEALLSNLLLGERIPLDIVNAEEGVVVVRANQRILPRHIRLIVDCAEHIEIDPSPIRIKIMDIIEEHGA